MKYTNEEMVSEIMKRSEKVQNERKRRTYSYLAGAGAVLFTALIAIIALIPADIAGPQNSETLYGSFLLNRAAGGYVLVALIAFVMGVIVAMCASKLRKDSSGSPKGGSSKRNRSILSVILAMSLAFSGMSTNMLVSDVQAATNSSTSGTGNALKAIGINSDAAPDGFDEEDTETNPYGKKTVTGDVSDEVFVANMGQKGSAIIGNEMHKVIGEAYTYNRYSEIALANNEGKYLMTYRNGSGYDEWGRGTQQRFVSEVAVAGADNEADAKKQLTDNGYTVIDRNLNGGRDQLVGVNVKYIYLGYKTSTNSEEAISNIMVAKYFGGNLKAAPDQFVYSRRTYKRVPVLAPDGDKFTEYLGNLNMKTDGGTQGLNMYLYYTLDPWDENNDYRITGLSADSDEQHDDMITLGGINVPDAVYNADNVGTYQDYINLNENGGGYYQYIHWTQTKKTGSAYANVEGTVSKEANNAALQKKYMNKTAGGNFDGNTEGKKSQFAMVSLDDSNGKLYLSVTDALTQNGKNTKELGFKLSPEVNTFKEKANLSQADANKLQAVAYMNVVTGDFDGNGRDEIAVFNPNSSAGPRVEVYGLKLPYDKYDPTDMNSWEIKRTIATDKDCFISMDTGDLDQDGTDDLVIGCNEAVTVYCGAHKSMLSKKYSVDLTNDNKIKDKVFDPSVAVFREKVNGKPRTYLGVMAKFTFDLTADQSMTPGYQYVYQFDPVKDIFAVVAVKDSFELVGMDRTVTESTAWDVFKVPIFRDFYTRYGTNNSENCTIRMPLEMHYMNHCFWTPYSSVGLGTTVAVRFQNQSLSLVNNTKQPQTVFSDGNGSQDGIICYDFQVADLNGTGTQTAFFKALALTDKCTFPVTFYVDNWNTKQNMAKGHYIGAYSGASGGAYMPLDMVYDPENPPVYAVLNTDDDTMYMNYTGRHSFSYSNPEVLAVLSSPPYFKDLVENDNLAGNYAESTTSYGKSKGSGSGTSDAVTITAGIFEKIEQDISVFGVKVASIEAEFSQTANFTSEFSRASEVNYTVEYGTSSGADAVVFYSVPTEIYEYETTYVDKKTGQKATYSKQLFFPKQPCVATIEREKYNTIAKNYSELPIIDDKVLNHRLGEPDSYPQTSSGYKNVREFDGNWMAVDFTSAGGGMSQSQSIEMSQENETSYSSGIELGFQGGVGAGGVTVGISGSEGYEAGYVYTTTSGSSYTAEMQNMPKEAEDYGYGMSWKLFTHEGSYVNSNGKTVKFPVVDYLVTDVMTPPTIPSDFRQDYSASTRDSVALEWEYDDPSKVECFNIYRLLTIDGRTYDTLAGIVPSYEGIKNDRDSYTYTFTDDGINADGTTTAMKPGIEYRYYIEAEGNPDNPPYLSMPSDEISAYTHSDSEYPDISLVGVKDGTLTVYPDMIYNIKAQVNNLDKFDQVSYHWEKYDVKKGFTEIKNERTDTLCINSATADAVGRYRCRVDAIFYNDNLQKLSTVTSYTDSFEIGFSMRPVTVDSIKASSDGKKPVGEITLKPADGDCFMTPSGEVQFIVENGGVKKYYTAELKKSGSRKATAKISDAEELSDGNYKLTVFYSGDEVFGSCTSNSENIIIGNESIYPVITDSQGRQTNTFEYGDEMHIDFYRFSSTDGQNTVATKLNDLTHAGGYREKLTSVPGDYKDIQITANLEGVGNKTFTYSYTVKKRLVEIGVPETVLKVGNVEGNLPVPTLAEGYTLGSNSDKLSDIATLRFMNSARNTYVTLNNDTEIGTYYAVLESKNNVRYDADLRSALITVGPQTYSLGLTADKLEGNQAGTITMNLPETIKGITDTTYAYEAGSELRLTAVPDKGYKFDHWEITVDGDSYTSSKPTITRTLMPVETSVKAVFASYSVRVTVDESLSEGGSIKLPEGFTNGELYQIGTEFTFVSLENDTLKPDRWIKNVGNKSYIINSDTLELTVPEQDVTLYPLFRDKNEQKPDPTVTAPVAKSNLTYDGKDKLLVDKGSVNGGTMYYAVTDIEGEEPADDSYSVSQPTGKNAGDYYVWYKVKGDEDHNDVDAKVIGVSISKASETVADDVTRFISRSSGEIKIDLNFDLPTDAGKVDVYEMSGQITTGSDKGVSANVIVNDAVIDAAGVMDISFVDGTAGDFIQVPVRVTAQNYDVSFNVVITLGEKDDPVYVKPEAKNLTYTGEDLELIKAGSVTTGGILEYSLSADSNYSQNIPTGREAGEYTVYYRITETRDTTGIDNKSLTVTIAPAKVTVKALDASKEKGEDDPEFEATVTGLVNGEDEALIGYTISRDEGEDEGTYVITPAGDTYQGNYAVTFEPGSFTIKPKKDSGDTSSSQKPSEDDKSSSSSSSGGKDSSSSSGKDDGSSSVKADVTISTNEVGGVIVKTISFNKVYAVKQKVDASAYLGTHKKYTVGPKGGAKVDKKKKLITLKKNGQITITAYDKENKQWVAKEVVIINAKTATVKQKKLEAAAQGPAIDGAANIDDGVLKPDKWVTSKASVATVDEKTGEIKPLSKGNATITAYYGEGKNASKVKFKVKVQ